MIVIHNDLNIINNNSYYLLPCPLTVLTVNDFSSSLKNEKRKDTTFPQIKRYLKSDSGMKKILKFCLFYKVINSR